MRKLTYFLLIPFFLFACSSPKSLLKKARYDALIKKSVKKLRVDPQDEKYIDYLNQAYNLANQQDQDKIKYLKQSGQPDRWGDVFNAYSRLKNRQDMVRTLSPSILNRIGFQYVDYDKDVISAKQNAAEYYYSHAVSLLEKGTKYDAQQAYNELSQVKSYYPNYRDTDALMQKALDIATNHVLYQMFNKTGVPFPPNFEDEVEKMSLKELNEKFLNFDVNPVEGRVYDYLVNLNINTIEVSPEMVDKNHNTYSKEVEDGWQYVLDNNGNVMKDSLGNDIKVTVYKTISCNVTEVRLKKTCNINGSVDFIREYTGEILTTYPMTAGTVFDYVHAIASGDLDACPPEVIKLVNKEPLPFPRSDMMILETADKMKGVVKDIIRRKRNLFK